MNKSIDFLTIIMLIFIGFNYIDGCNQQKQIENFKVRIDSLTQERSHIWMDAQGVLSDSIYFVSWDSSTTWYVKADTIKLEYSIGDTLTVTLVFPTSYIKTENLKYLYKYLHPQTADSIYKFLQENR